METTTIPFSLPLTARSWEKAIGSSAGDQQLINAFYETASDNEQGSKILYVTKRAGSTTSSTIGTTPRMMTCYSSTFSDLSVSLPGGTGTLYSSSTAAGTMSGSSYPDIQTSYLIPDGVIAGNAVVCFTTFSAGYYLFNDALTTNFPTFSGDTHTNTVIDNIASTTGIYVGQAISGTGIQAGTRVATITSATAITVTIATTASATITITKEALAKIIDSDFPSTAGTMTQMDGFFYVSESATQRIYNSKLNDPAVWTAGDYITADFSGDSLYFIFRHQDMIVAAGTRGTVEYFRRGQTSTGTVLTKVGADRTIQMFGIPVHHSTGSYFIGAQGTQQGWGLFRMNGQEFTRVSDDITSAVIDEMVNEAVKKFIADNPGVEILGYHVTGDIKPGTFNRVLVNITYESSKHNSVVSVKESPALELPKKKKKE